MVRRLAPVAALLVAIGAAASGAASGGVSETRRAVIYSIRPDGSDRRLVARPDPPIACCLVRSADGRRILAPRVDGLYVSDLSGQNAVRIASGGVGVLSPDTTKIALTTFTGCGWRCVDTALYVVNADGSGLSLVDDDGRSPSWSPDSRKLAFQGTGGLNVATLASGAVKNLGLGTNPVWAPRGNRIAYVGFSRGYAVPCLVNADRSRRRCLGGFSVVWSFVWSPDAKRVLFSQAEPARLAILNADGSGLRRLGRADPTYKRPRPLAWSPDGRRIAYSHARYDGYPQIFVRAASGRGRPRIVTDEAGYQYFDDARWRDGRISYVLYE